MERRNNFYQQESAHERIYGSQHGKKTVTFYDETRNTKKQTDKNSNDMNKIVSQKMVSSSSLKETSRDEQADEQNLCEDPGELKQAEQAEDPE